MDIEDRFNRIEDRLGRLETMGPPVQVKLKTEKAGHRRSLFEYGLIAALIAVAIITAMSKLGNDLKNTFNNVQDEIGNGP